jgi:hypothetical protein
MMRGMNELQGYIALAFSGQIGQDDEFYWPGDWA